MRRVGVKRVHPEPLSRDYRELPHKPPNPKRARQSANIRPRDRGLLQRAYDWCRSKMSSLYSKVFSGWRTRGQDDNSDSDFDESFSSCTQESPASASRGSNQALSRSMPPVPNTAVGVVTQHHAHSFAEPFPSKPRLTKSLTQSQPRAKPTRSKQMHGRPASKTLYSAHHPFLTTPSNSVLTTHPDSAPTHTPLTQSTPSSMFTPRLATKTTPISSTPFSMSLGSHAPYFKPSPVLTVSHSRGDGEVGRPSTSQESYLPLLREIPINKTPDSALGSSTLGLKERPQEKRAPLSRSRKGSAVDSSTITEMQEWLQNLQMTKSNASHDRQAEAELIENRLRVYRAERREIENGRAIRLRSLIQSPRVPEPAPAKLNFDLSQEQVQRVAMALGRGSSAECLSNGFNISITRSDLGSLVGLNWLNDNVVNFYFNLIRAAHPGVHVMSSFFYPKLSQSGYTSVRRWTKKVDIFAQEQVLFPIHLGMHWCLAAADFRDSTLSYYDSLSGDNHACLSRLRSYLEDESENKKGTRHDFSSWKLVICKGIPLQENGSDCGVFMCMYARHLAKGLPFNFSQMDAPQIRQAMIWEILEQKLLE